MRSIFMALACAIGIIFVLDFFAYVPYGWKYPTALIVALSGGFFVLMKLIRGEFWSYLAIACTTGVITIACIELVFQMVLLDPLVPKTDDQFNTMIRSSWPEDRTETRSDTSKTRILGLADSFGRMGEDKNYHYQLEDIAAEKGDNVEVVNLSKHGYQPEDEILLISRFGERYSPDIVLHGLFVGNDFANPDGEYLQYEGIYVRKRPGLDAFRPIFFTSSQWTRKALRVIQERQRKQEEDTSDGYFSDETFLEIERERMKFYRHGEDAKWGPIAEILDEIVKEAQDMGAIYVMVVHPDQAQVHADLPIRIQDRFGIDLNDYDFDLPQEFLRKFSEERGLYFIDLLPTFQSYGRDGGYYLKNDAHYDDEGNALAARTIYEHLKTEGLLP